MEKKTKVCCLDVDKNIIDYLHDDFDVYEGSFGKIVNLENCFNYSSRELLLLNHDFPNNIHEYNVIISDLNNNVEIPYVDEEHTRRRIDGKKALYFACYRPTTLFNPKPFAAKILKQTAIDNPRFIINLVFQSEKKEIEYCISDITSYQTKDAGTYTNYDHINNYTSKTICGEEIQICDNKIAHTLFDCFVDELTYYQTFFHPQKPEGSNWIYNPQFIPLLKNNNGDIISYIWQNENNLTIMLPQAKSKLELLKVVFNEILYKHFSQYFPSCEQSSWTSLETYQLPNEKNLLSKKETIQNEYEKKLSEIDKEIEDNKLKYDFLHNLLTESGNELVKHVVTFLEWLGFEKVKSMDEHVEGDVFEEDIQVDLGEKGLLIIEVKGLYGTSKDSECSQISKIRRRREKERGKFDVFPLYIANNERGKEPLKRTIPPFNEIQIQDATNDERGLTYTWQLYNLYYNIEAGVMTKEDARKRFTTSGLLDFTPELKELGIPYKYFRNHTVACIELNDFEIKTGDVLAYESSGKYTLVKIVNIEIEKTAVQSARSGKVGIELDMKIPEKTPLYFIKNGIANVL